ncbi:MAG: ABC transporter ATP-binding protein, partial [Pseudomonadota bacterium]|nr:ABC transporter ATP-binding protein [Pseudomonadota bacterium]
MTGIILDSPPSTEFLIRMDEVDGYLTRINFGTGFRAMLSRAGEDLEPPFQNTLLVGPKGTGKTTRAKV